MTLRAPVGVVTLLTTFVTSNLIKGAIVAAAGVHFSILLQLGGHLGRRLLLGDNLIPLTLVLLLNFGRHFGTMPQFVTTFVAVMAYKYRLLVLQL